MRRMELTPELFEKIEFTERRKGYDTEQVETFLEEAGTALAQVLARVRHTEERAAHAESRLADAEQKLNQAEQILAEADRRVQQAEQRAQQTQQSAAAAQANEQAEVEQAARTLLLAQRTAEETVAEARGQAQTLLEEARATSDRQLRDATAEAEQLVRKANEQAEVEFADRRAAVLEDVQGLELRRSQLNDVITQMEARLAGYREDLRRAADELVAMAEDPGLLGARPTMSIRADEVLTSAPAGEAHLDEEAQAEPGFGFREPVAQPESQEPVAEAGDVAPAGGAGTADGPQATSAALAEQPDPGDEADAAPQARSGQGEAVARAATEPDAQDDDPGERTQYLDLTTGSPSSEQVAAGDRWGPGSWADLEAELDEDPSPEAVPAADRVGTPRDRFMEELDSAVNEAVDMDDDAMTAFFQGTSDSRARRFGWRR
jgi:cell division septum initiation protein DivIVA